MVSCRTIKEIPVQTIEKIIYRDTLVYIKDSIKVDVPYEVIKEVIPSMDTSYIKTSVAESVAYVDTNKKKLYHTLTQNGEIIAKLDTVIRIEYVDKITYRDVPIQVEVVKYKRDSLFWVLAGWAMLCILLVGLKLFVIK
jgi:hypothetical protein